MSGHERPEENSLARAVEQRRARRRLWARLGDSPVVRHLAMIGSLGWLLVTPTLLGALAGRWLDAILGSGVFWSASLIVLGAALGFWMVWQRLEEERRK